MINIRRYRKIIVIAGLGLGAVSALGVIPKTLFGQPEGTIRIATALLIGICGFIFYKYYMTSQPMSRPPTAYPPRSYPRPPPPRPGYGAPPRRPVKAPTSISAPEFNQEEEEELNVPLPPPRREPLHERVQPAPMEMSKKIPLEVDDEELIRKLKEAQEKRTIMSQVNKKNIYEGFD